VPDPVDNMLTVTVTFREAWVSAKNVHLASTFDGWHPGGGRLRALIVSGISVHRDMQRKGMCKRFLGWLTRDPRYSLVIVEMVQNPILAAALTRWGWVHDPKIMDFYFARTHEGQEAIAHLRQAPCPHPSDSTMGYTEDGVRYIGCRACKKYWSAEEEDEEPRSRVTDPARVVTALLLTDAGLKPGSALEHDFDALTATVEGWTDDQRAAAFEWAALEHLAAGGNDVARVPCPPHVQATRPDYARKARNG